MTSSRTLLELAVAELGRTYPGDDGQTLREAVAYSQNIAGDDVTKTSMQATTVLAKMHLDQATLSACVLAGCCTFEQLGAVKEHFGEEISQMVEGTLRVQSIRWDRLESEASESLRKMFIAMAAEVRVVVIALALRVQHMTAAAESPDTDYRLRMGHETLQVFSPLANRLGIWQLKSRLEDLSFQCLQPEAFLELDTLLKERRQARLRLIDRAIQVLVEKLPEQGIIATVNGRAKHHFSIFRKMERKKVGLDQIHDVNAVRVITEKVADCYAVLGLVHSLWVPLPGQFDDYIARPKENLYRSLHTTVLGPEGKPLEIQIRTKQMHQYAENGVAAHWAYKEGRKSVKDADQKFVVLRQLMDWERDVSDPHQFAERLKTDVFRDQVYVFTPAGDIVDLPLGATPLDFAYRIHTMVGHRCRGARVNDQIVSLDYQLKTGDRVEILTHKQPHPSRDWLHPALGFLNTSSARSKVRAWFRDQEKDAAIQQGKEIVERELHRLALHYVTQHDLVEHFGYLKIEDLYAAVGFGIRSSHAVASVALQIEQKNAPLPIVQQPLTQDSPVKPQQTSGLSLAGVRDIMGKRAQCCSPVPGDKVIGFVSRGRGIIIHRKDCTGIDITKEPQRWVCIDWGPELQERHTVNLELTVNDRQGLLRDLAALIAQTGADVRGVQAQTKARQNKVRITVRLDITGADQMLQIMDKLERYKDVYSVKRLGKKSR